MTFKLNEIVPWGRSFDEYVAMFALSGTDLAKRILGCGDGPAAFNTELTRRGGNVVSIDPLYAFSSDDIRRRIDETFSTVMDETKKNQHEFVWKTISSVDELGKLRMTAMHDFLSDFEQGKVAGRYLAESAPALSLPDNCFDLTLSSHFLFLYSDHLDIDFHIDTVTELCRVSTEVRVFPLLKLGASFSPHVKPLTEHFRGEGYAVTQVTVPYEFQRGGNKMLRVCNVRSC